MTLRSLFSRGYNGALNSSAINTWVAEELRSTGAEFTLSRRPSGLGGAHTFSINVAAFMGNDPAGSLLAWKGWSVHDRQSRFSDDLPLPPLPQIQPDGMFSEQDPYVEPFQEIDDEVSYRVAPHLSSRSAAVPTGTSVGCSAAPANPSVDPDGPPCATGRRPSSGRRRLPAWKPCPTE